MRAAGLSGRQRQQRPQQLFEPALFDGVEPAPATNATPPARKPSRVLVLSVSAGAGHVRAAEALAAHARAGFPLLSVSHRDMMALVPRWFCVIYRDLYMKLSSGLPEAWGWLYRKTDNARPASIGERVRRRLQRLCARRLLAEIEACRPDAIVCTHFLPAELLADERRAGRLDCPVWVQVTDFDLHRMWVHEGVSGYFVGSDELAFRLAAHGVPAAQVVVSGIPVMPGFLAAPQRTQAAAVVGLDPALPTVLMMSGGGGSGMQVDTIQSLLLQQPRLQLIVLAGRNDALRRSLQDLTAAYAGRLRCFGFIEDVHLAMACADLAITKPGGLSTSECLAMGLPMLLVNPIPGQEERNAAYLMQEGAAARADDPVTLQFRLQRLLDEPGQLARMRERALAIARPHAAHTLLQRLG